MKTILVTIFIFSLVSSVNSSEVNALSLLERDLWGLSVIHPKKEIRYCPDNTCEIYKANNPHSDFPAFIYLYLFHKSEYIYLDERISGSKAFRKRAVEEPAVREKMASYCQSEQQSIACLLDGMKKVLDISSCFGRYDEGYFCHNCVDGKQVCENVKKN